MDDDADDGSVDDDADDGIVDDDADNRCNSFDPVIHCVTHHSPIRVGTQRM